MINSKPPMICKIDCRSIYCVYSENRKIVAYIIIYSRPITVFLTLQHCNFFLSFSKEHLHILCKVCSLNDHKNIFECCFDQFTHLFDEQK